MSLRTPPHRVRHRAALPWFVLLCAACSLPLKAQPIPLVRAERGTLPIVLTAPHGGTLPIPGVPERTSGVRVRDENTELVADHLWRRLHELTGARPHLVQAQFHRRFADANRPPEDAFEDERARPHYEAYHHGIRRAVREIREKSARGGLLVDLHGQSRDPETIHRGTLDGLTVKALLETHGADALTGEDSPFGHLKASGFTVFPDNTPPGEPPEAPAFRGGFAVATYGSHQADGIDAIQVEIGRALRRDPARRRQVVEALARGIAAYWRRYLR